MSISTGQKQLRQKMQPLPWDDCNAGTEHVGFSPTRQTSLAPSAKRREVFGESHEGWAASYQEPLVRRTFLHMDDSVEFVDFLSTSRDSNDSTITM